MAEVNIAELWKHLPEVFEQRNVPDSFDADYIFIDSPEPFEAYSSETEDHFVAPNDADDFNGDRWVSTALLQDELTYKGTGYPDVRSPLTGDFPGAPVTFDPSTGRPPVDAMAFYLPFHHFWPDWWGIYFNLEWLAWFAADLYRQTRSLPGAPTLAQCVDAARLFLGYHELYHHNIESFATRLEVSHRKKLYIDSFRRLYRRTQGADACWEEALCDANAYRKIANGKFFPKETRSVIAAYFLDYIRQSPPSYRMARDILKDKQFKVRQNQFAEDNFREAFPSLPAKSADLWNSSQHMFRGMADLRVKACYFVRKDSVIAQRIPGSIRERIDARRLRRKLKKLGCVFIRQGKGSHEIWRGLTGEEFPVPVHPGDIPTGTLNAILQQSGLKDGLGVTVATFTQA